MASVNGAVALGDGRFAVPGNRWDLLDHASATARRVSVVVPYFSQQGDLDRLLAALAAQTYPLDLIEVVVADDGSPEPPIVSSRLRHRVVRQSDKGFRAAAARNLGVQCSSGDVVCFLDADMVPELDYLARITRLPSLLSDALVVGRRRHADLTGWTGSRLIDWFRGGAAPTPLDEPAWLDEAYDRTHDLLHLDHRSYRYVISAVMCCTRTLFDDIGGFDETFDEYGGEDWELAHRALVGGAVLHRARRAVAWHNGPDWAGRAVNDRAGQKNREAQRVAAKVPDSESRTRGQCYPIPEVAIQLKATALTGAPTPHEIEGILALDAHLWVTGGQSPATEAIMPHVHRGHIPDHVKRQCRFVVLGSGREALSARSLGQLIEACSRPGVGRVRATVGAGWVICEASWALNRTRRAVASGSMTAEEAADLFQTVDLHLPPTTSA